MCLVIFFAGIFLFIGAIHLALGILDSITGFIVSGSICTAIGLAILIPSVIRSIKEKRHPELYKAAPPPPDDEEEDEDAQDKAAPENAPAAPTYQGVEVKSGSSGGGHRGEFFALGIACFFILFGIGIMISGIRSPKSETFLFGAAFTGFALFMTIRTLLPQLLRGLRNDRLREKGRKVWAVITEVKPYKKGEKVIYLLTCQAEGRLFRFNAESNEPEKLEGQTVAVYYSEKDPSKYYVDTYGLR